MRTINREILALAVPAIATNITTPLLGLVDTALTGHMGRASYIGAIAVGAGMLSLAYWPLNFLRMGTSGLAAQAYGSRDKGEADATAAILFRSLLVALACSALLLLASPWMGGWLLGFMDAEPDTSRFAARYFAIVIWGAPAVLATYSLTGWLLGMQDSRTPMVMALVTNISNIALSALLVFGFHLKIEGVAIGTAAAQWLGLIVGAIATARKYGGAVRLPQLGALLRGDKLALFFKINADIFLRTLCLAAVTFAFTRAGAKAGTDTLAANALLMQLFILFSYFMDGFAFAGEALAGKYHGMRRPRALSLTVRALFRWGWRIAAFATVIYACLGRYILLLLTSSAAVIDTALGYMPWAVAVPATAFAAFIWDGVFVGLTRTRAMLASMAAAMAVFFAADLAAEPFLRNHGLWLAFIAYLLTRSLLQTFFYTKRH